MCCGGVADLSYPSSKTRRGRVQEGGWICPKVISSVLWGGSGFILPVQ
nr:MAG TPA: hypothetical protein [Caudoviricetes sp.]